MLREPLSYSQLTLNQIQIRGYSPGVIGEVTKIHGKYYSKNWELDASFETEVGIEFAEFISEFQSDRDGLWVAYYQDQFAGSIAIDGRQADRMGSRLRWFIVAPEFQGLGLGRVLMKMAIQFCQDTQQAPIYLWTFSGLDTAHHLYRAFGFQLVEEHSVVKWGRSLRVQKFQLDFRVS
ncbi:MAG: GNAT family N-acetyltransferase [Elainellaceae cyanobacterium]